jgi:two-component sensor histidine kinase
VEGQVTETAALLVTELVTNAVLYSPGDHVTLTLLVEDEIEVSVWDDDPRLIVLPDPVPDGLHGRGLLLVDHLATAWGSLPEGEGKTVWFRLSQPLAGH